MSKHIHVTDFAELCRIVEKCGTITLAMNDGEYPYVIPLSFLPRVENGVLVMYIHGSVKGKKLELIRRDPHVGFTVCYSREPAEGLECGTANRFESVCGYGLVTELADEDKPEIFKLLMPRYNPGVSGEVSPGVCRATSVMRLEVLGMTGRTLEKRDIN